MATRTFTFDSTSDYPSVVDLVVNVGASFTCTYTVNDTSGTAIDLANSLPSEIKTHEQDGNFYQMNNVNKKNIYSLKRVR